MADGDPRVIDLSSLATDEVRIGSQIGAETVRLIGADGTQLGLKTTEEALRLATEAELDLVEINPRADPPVCKIMSFAEFKRAVAYRKSRR